ncbi:MAG: B12-binding domain-containing radical SAM protein [Nanoarchaeota archaeon]|nr:B12-binding domain-containing radical SAM protein [Nanoarchaeota archaeon]
MIKHKVTLLSPLNRAKSIKPPLALMSIVSYLEKKGVEADLFDIKSHKGNDYVLDRIIERIQVTRPDSVGITCLTPDVLEVKRMVHRIRKEFENIKIIVGGIHPNLFLQDFLYENSPIDIVVIGEGEITLTEICNALSTNEDISKIKGIAYFKEGKIVQTERREYIQDLDSMPFLAYDKVDMGYYTRPSLYVIRGIFLSAFYMITSRGCPYSCKFCVDRHTSDKRIRAMSPKRVVDEMEYLIKKYKIDGICFYDDTFTASKQRALDICNEIKSRNINILWSCQTRVNLLTEELAKAMSDAGCIQIAFGVESGSQEMLNKINKLIKIEDARQAFKICKKYNIKQFANFMINLPNETLEQLNQTISLAKELNANLTVFNVTTPYPGSGIYSQFSDKIKLTEVDYPKLANYESYYDFLEFIETRAKISRYDTPLIKILEKVWIEFPGTKDFSPKLSMKYARGAKRAIDFIWHPKYIKQIMVSSKKMKYISGLCHIFKKHQ